MFRFCCVLLLVLASCHTDKPTGNFKSFLNNSVNSENTKVSLEGAYSENNNAGDYLRKSLFFFKNDLVFYDYGNVPNPSGYYEWLRKYLPEKKTWGTYKISSDTINVCIYFLYIGGFANHRLTCFQGIIKNRDTILQWHIIEPYPKLKKYTKEDYAPLFTKKTDLYFKPLSIKPFMDSISEKAWILKYRDKR